MCFTRSHPKCHWESIKEAILVAVKEKIRIRLKSYDHQLIDQAAEKIVETLGENAIDVILRNRQALDEVPKLSKKLADLLK